MSSKSLGLSSPSKSKTKHDDQASLTNHFENLANGSMASTSTLIKPHQDNQNGVSKIEMPVKKFNPSSEQVITPPTATLPIHTNNVAKLSNMGIVHNNVNKIDEKLEKMRWFHGLLVRDQAEKLLVKDGDYLVRETNKADRQYVLSGRYKGECRHIFLVDPSGVVSFFCIQSCLLFFPI